MRILVVGGVPSVHQSLVSFLRSSDVAVDESIEGAQAVELAKTCTYDAVLAEVVLQDIDGYELTTQLRGARIGTPIILMAECAPPQARIKAFACGADDLVIGSCDPVELLARIRAIARRNKGYQLPPLRCGQLRLDQSSHEVWVGDRPVHLTRKEYAVLELLVLRKGMALTKEVFLNHLYGGLDEPEAKIIDVFICKVRRKLAEAGVPDIITTVWGRGYTVHDIGSHSLPPAVTPWTAPVLALTG